MTNQTLSTMPSPAPSKGDILRLANDKFQEYKDDLIAYFEVDLEREINQNLKEDEDGFLIPWQRILLRKRAVKHEVLTWGKVDFDVNFNLNQDIITIKIVIKNVVEKAKYLRKALFSTKSRDMTIKIASISVSQGFKLVSQGGEMIVVQQPIQNPEISSPDIDVSGGGPFGAWLVEKFASTQGGRVVKEIQSNTKSTLRKELPRYAAKSLGSLKHLIHGYRIMEPGFISPSSVPTQKLLASNACQGYGFTGTEDSKWTEMVAMPSLSTCTELTCSL